MAMKATVTVFLFFSLFGLNTSFYRRHYFVRKYLSWLAAQQFCRNNYDDLSTVSYTKLQSLSANPLITSDYYWIGLHRDANNTNLWRWTGGETVNKDIWEEGQPDDVNEQCGAVRKSSSNVYNFGCQLVFQFYCMEVFELIVVQQESTWEEALLYCRRNYIDLAILSSDVIMTEANDKSTQALTDNVWIGLCFLAGHWFWVNGEGLGYKFWSAGGEPQCPAMDQRCGVYDRTQSVWKHTDCERRLNFICVKKP